jgi:hypothetical protein
MKSKYEILKDAKWNNPEDGFQDVFAAMEAYAKEESIAFHDWYMKNAIAVRLLHKLKTTEKLYNYWKQEFKIN